MQHLRQHERLQLKDTSRWVEGVDVCASAPFSLTGTRIAAQTLVRDKGAIMAKQLVEVIDRHGHVVDRYTVALPDAECHDTEYEEVALILAEQSGRIEDVEIVHLRARCVR